MYCNVIGEIFMREKLGISIHDLGDLGKLNLAFKALISLPPKPLFYLLSLTHLQVNTSMFYDQFIL